MLTSRRFQLPKLYDVSRGLYRCTLPFHFHVGRLRGKQASASDDSPEGEKEIEFRLHKSKGQHLLVNPRVLDNILREADVRRTDTVLEIGPGTGNLTLKLLEACRRVVAVEIDRRMVAVLLQRVADHGSQQKLTVIQKDALKVEFPQFDIVVANIPYGISSPLIFKLVYGESRFRSATLLLQHEFAKRLLANPGESEYNRLAANVKLVADVTPGFKVSKRDFLPIPKVDSSVVTIRPKAQIPDVNIAEWLAFTRTCFGKKNKTLGATFKQKRKLAEIFRTSMENEMNKECSVDGYRDNQNISDKDDSSEEDTEEPTEDCLPAHAVESEISLFREKIIRVLRSCGFEDKRPSKLSNGNLLHLLELLNDAGVYFRDCRKPQAENHANAML
ncbi:hypothetical protein MLD38_028582 [Melastoma candidum]|uniref:Uncharacterized protein n=1 Tax=Melastoma candidum TaxID=119954 RepID=A0ACB9N166_9MYRT|nr:hypothetical protein MLD38_028582 [Melastoma candidum]